MLRKLHKSVHSNTGTIEKLSPPTNFKSLRAFLGKVNYYKKFTDNWAKLLHPLYQLHSKDKEWNWDEDTQNAFEKVKILLINTPVLRLFDPALPIFIYTHASRAGIGAMLKQIIGDSQTQHAVNYFQSH